MKNQFTTPNSQLTTLNSQFSTLNSQLSTLNSQLPTPNSQLSTLNSQLKQFAFRVYFPIITRIERFRAVRMWRDGVRQAEKMRQQLGGNRVYLLFDAKHMCWSPMTWRDNKLLKPAFLQLRRMGKMRASQHIRTPRDLEYYSFYFTRSKKKPHSAADTNRLRQNKLQKWIEYYMFSLSEPMRKCREYINKGSAS